MQIKNWIACVQDPGKWKEVVEKAKTFNQEVQRLEEEEVVSLNDTFISIHIMLWKRDITFYKLCHNQVLVHSVLLLYLPGAELPS